jgi:spore germination protein YaaH
MKPLFLALLLPVLALAQQEVEHKSIHQLESELHRNDPVTMAEKPSVVVPFLPKAGRASALAKKVYGWHPYWASSGAYQSYDYGALSHIAYFSYETDTATGGYTTIRDWNTTPIIAYAHQRGVKVTLTVTNFGYDQNDKLLSDTLKQERMITTLISLLKSRSGDGVNFDLEMVRNTQRASLVSFMRRASTRIKAEIPLAEISMATPAVDWSVPGSWDFAQLAQVCDYLIVMGYAYYYGGSLTAGPVAPLAGENYNITRTIDTYLAVGVPPQKLYLGVPWYGIDWPVQSSVRKSPATGTASSRTYVVAEPMAALYGKVFDQTTKVPWFAYNNGSTWRQVWYDDSTSLAMKYGLVNARDLGGIGIWALSYDGGRPEIWNGIKSAFTPTGVETVVGETPQRFELLQNYPNPFNPTTAISFQLSEVSFVTLKVFDVLGREITTLVNEMRKPGLHTVQWDASSAPSGVYLYRLRSGEISNGTGRSFMETKRMTLLR